MSLTRRSLAIVSGNLAVAAALCCWLLIGSHAIAAQAAPQQLNQQATSSQQPADPIATNTADQQEFPAVADSLFSQTYQTCMDEAAGTTTAMQDCMAAEQQRLETHLAAQRSKVAAGLNQERSKAFNEALDAWDTLRKSGSLAMYDPDGGTLSPLMTSLWYLEQTARMSRWVDSMLENVDP